MSKEAMKLALEALEEPHPGIRTSFTDAITYREKVKQAITALRKALAEQPAPVQQGWKLVPVEPTMEMIAALGFDGAVDMAIGHAAISKGIEDAYTVMLAVAPQPAQQCRTDGRCQYAIDSGAEGMGHCPKGKCVMPAQQQKPDAIVTSLTADPDGVASSGLDRELPLMASVYLAPQPAQRKPLDDEVIRDCWFSVQGVTGISPKIHASARAIEVKHNIKENT